VNEENQEEVRSRKQDKEEKKERMRGGAGKLMNF
jgi:hypothetical protein